jgi:undecaprenyl-diphosphatase
VSYFQAIVIGVLQGITELFPVSSLGHSILIPSLLGWDSLVKGQAADESFYLAFLVGLHVATALALLVFYRRDWDRIIRGFFRSIAHRRVETADERLAWLLIFGTIAVGLFGLAFEHPLRVLFAKPLAAAIFLTLNGVILYAGERLRRRVAVPVGGPKGDVVSAPAARLESLPYKDGAIIGASQIGALFAGISRSGITMVAGLLRGLDHEDSARFAFLLATPVILLAGLYKLPDLMGPLGNGIRPQILVGSVCAAVAAYLSVRFLTRFFTTRTLTPFAIYCLVFGIVCTVHFA